MSNDVNNTPCPNMPESINGFYRIIPTAIDLLTVAGYYFFVPWFASLMLSQSAWNHVFLIPVFFMLPAGIALIRSLPYYALDDEKLVVFAAILAFIQVILFIWLYTSVTNIGGNSENNDIAVAIIFFLYIFPYLMAFSWPKADDATHGTKKVFLIEVTSIAIVNYFTLIGSAVFLNFLSIAARESQIYSIGLDDIFIFIIVFPVYLVFFGLPRIYLIRATGDHVGFIIYLTGIAQFLFPKIPLLN